LPGRARLSGLCRLNLRRHGSHLSQRFHRT
jgi:hypothetical protein